MYSTVHEIIYYYLQQCNKVYIYVCNYLIRSIKTTYCICTGFVKGCGQGLIVHPIVLEVDRVIRPVIRRQDDIVVLGWVLRQGLFGRGRVRRTCLV